MFVKKGVSEGPTMLSRFGRWSKGSECLAKSSLSALA